MHSFHRKRSVSACEVIAEQSGSANQSAPAELPSTVLSCLAGSRRCRAIISESIPVTRRGYRRNVPVGSSLLSVGPPENSSRKRPTTRLETGEGYHVRDSSTSGWTASTGSARTSVVPVPGPLSNGIVVAAVNLGLVPRLSADQCTLFSCVYRSTNQPETLFVDIALFSSVLHVEQGGPRWDRLLPKRFVSCLVPEAQKRRKASG